MASKVINTILNLKDNFSDTVNKVAQNTSSFRNGMKGTENQALSMKKTVSDAFGTIKDSMLRGIGFGAGMDIFEKMKDSVVETVTFGNELQKSLNGVMASSGLAETGMKMMKGVMTDIYNDNFGENFEDIAEAIKGVQAQTGATGDRLKSLTENAISLRDTFGFEVNESMRSASMLMNQFGVSGQEAFNLIAQGKQGGLDFSGEMLDSINEYSVQFKKLGLNAEDMFNIFQSGSAEGAFNLDKVGDAVKEFSIRSVDGSKTTIDGFTQLGFNANDLSSKFAQGGDTAKSAFKDVVNALGTMKDPLKQSQVGVELFGTQFEDLGINVISGLKDMDGEISNTYDALGQINKIKYNDIGSAFEGIKRNIQTSVLIPISDAVLPRLNDFANWFKNNIPNIKENISGVVTNFLNIASSIVDKVWPSLSNLIDSATNLGKTIYDSVLPAFDSVKPDNWISVGDAIKDIVDKATEVVKYVNDNWPTIKPIIEDIIAAMVAWKFATMAVDTWIKITTATAKLMGTIELIIWGIRNATTAWEAAQFALNVVMEANPIGFIISLIALLGFAIYEVIKHWEDIYNWIKWVWSILQDNPILLFISTVLNPFGTALVALIANWDKVIGVIKDAWNWLTSWIDKWNGTKLEDKNVNIKTNEERITQGAGADFADTFNAAYNAGNNATGTNYWRGGRTWVGEHGPELLNLPRGSKVYTNSQSKQMSNGNGEININLTVQGNMIGNEEFANQLGQHIYNQIQLSMVNS